MALRPAKLGVSLFRHPCLTAPFPRERGILLGLPPLVPVGGSAPATPFLSTKEVFRQSVAINPYRPVSIYIIQPLMPFFNTFFKNSVNFMCKSA